MSRPTAAGRGAAFFAGDSAARAVTFAVLVGGARVLGPAQFGRFAFVYGTVGLALLIGDMGLTPFILRRLSQRERFDGSAFWCGVATNLTIGAGAYAVLLSLFAAGSTETLEVVAVYGAVLFTQSLGTSLDAALFSRGRSPIVGALRLLGNGFLALAAVCALLIHPSPVTLAAAFVVGGVAKAALGSIAARQYIVSGRVSRRVVAVMLRKALPFAAAAVASFLYFRVDVVLLGLMSSNRSVGVYSAAYRLLDGMMLLPVAFAYSLFPEWVRRRETSWESVRDVVRAAVAVGLALAMGLALWAGPLIQLLYGRSFAPASAVLKIIGVTLPVLFVDVLAVWVAYARYRERAVVGIGLFAFAVNLGLNLFLIPRFDIKGAAVATVVSEVANAAGYAYVFRAALRRNAHSLLREARRMLSGSAIVAASVSLADLHILPALAAVAVGLVGVGIVIGVGRNPRRVATGGSIG